MNRFVVAALAIASVGGCGKSKAQCKTDVDELMTFLRSFDHRGSMFQVTGDMHLVERAGLAVARQLAPVVVIDAKETTYQGQVVDATALGERLISAGHHVHEDVEMGRVPRGETVDPDLLYFEISGDATWDRVVAAVRVGADAGFRHAAFVFLVPSPPPPPPRTWVDDKFDAIRAKNPDGGNLATGIAQITQEIVKSCPGIVKAFGSVAADEGGDKAGYLIEALGPALLDCRCDVDIPALRSAMWIVMGNPHPTSALQVQLDGDGHVISLPAATPWREASKQLKPADVVWLATP